MTNNKPENINLSNTLFSLLTFLKPIDYFNLKNRNKSSIYPDPDFLPIDIIQKLDKDMSYSDKNSIKYDLAFQALQKGFVDENQTIKDFKKVPLEDQYKFAKKNLFSFPYLNDETQEIAKTYDAVCTPDFFGYNKDLELQYRGRLRELKNLVPVRSGESDLLIAMKQIAETGKGPENQTPSAGCGIKWKQ